MDLTESIRRIEQSHKFDGHSGSKTMRRRAALLYLITLDSGFDESFGTVDSGPGWNARIGRHIVNEDGDGFFEVETFATEDIAKANFAKLEESYG